MRADLVVGYGNGLRRDDGAGRRVARLIAAMGLGSVRVIECRQLTPELAAAVAEAHRVVFVDATGTGRGRVGLRRLVRKPCRSAPGHAGGPAELLDYAARWYGNAPAAWLLTVRGWDFGFGEGLSPGAWDNVQRASRRVAKLLGLNSDA